MIAKAPDARSRVIVAVGTGTADPQALAAAALLAQSAKAGLTALFVEDINLLRLAELPFAFEIGTTSAAPRRFAASDVERAFKSEADELRRALAEMASALELDLSFEIARGRPARVLLEASGEMDLVVLASAAVRSLTHTPAASVVRSALHATSSGAKPHRPRPVAAMLQSGPTGLRVLAAAHGFALASAADLVLLIAESGAQGAELSAVAGAWLDAQNTTARMTQLPDVTPVNVAKLVANEGSHALFWPGDGEMMIAAEIEALLEVINCPLIVVR